MSEIGAIDFRWNAIFQHEIFCLENNIIETYEKERIFCKHGIEHVLDVARIMYLYSLLHKISIEKDIIYAAGILHDIGRSAEYKNGIPHHKAGTEKIKIILFDCGYNYEEINTIIDAILHHGDVICNNMSLDTLLQYADKESRNCFYCKVSEICNWDNADKNMQINF